MSDSLRLLIVDDYSDTAQVLQLLLERMNCTVRVCHSGEECLEAIEEFRPHAALLDLGMPAMDGFELARRLRDKPQLDRVQLFAVSGYGGADDIERCRQAGFVQHLLKPVAATELKALVENLRTSHDGETQ